MSGRFTYFGKELELFDHPYNSTVLNERAVEVPIAVDFLAGEDLGAGLELGNVLGHYGLRGHRVVDRYERAAGVDNVDVFDLEGAYPWLVTISTVEHVRKDERPRNALGSAAAILYLLGLLAPGGRMLLTAPLGHHRELDRVLLDGKLEPERAATLVRDGDGWVQTPELVWKPYGATTRWAESVFVGEWRRS